MKFKVFYEPVFHIVIEDCFSDEVNKKILEEAIKNKDTFKPATINSGTFPEFRSNTASYYDNVYQNLEARNKSPLLVALNDLYGTDEFREIMASSPEPINNFTLTNYHETQVSRYGSGGDGQKYNWHIDKFNDNMRMMTFVYYFNNEPKKYTGGEISFTNSPIFRGEPIDKDAKIINHTPKNNMAVIFGASVPHMVQPTISPDEFEDGRFSVNCWIGVRQ